MKKEIYICDRCGAEKREANHWWVLINGDGCIGVYHWSWFAYGNAKHLCGQACAIATVSEFMEGKK